MFSRIRSFRNLAVRQYNQGLNECFECELIAIVIRSSAEMSIVKPLARQNNMTRAQRTHYGVRCIVCVMIGTPVGNGDCKPISNGNDNVMMLWFQSCVKQVQNAVIFK